MARLAAERGDRRGGEAVPGKRRHLRYLCSFYAKIDGTAGEVAPSMGSAPQSIVCNRCRHSNPSGSSVCTNCHASLSNEDLTMTSEDITRTGGDLAPDWSRAGSGEGPLPLALGPGDVL